MLCQLAAFLLALVGTHVSAQQSLPSGTSWALLAWGFDSGGKDTVGNNAVVFIDIDEADSRFKSLKSDGKYIVCYVSIGTLEPWRSDTTENQAKWKEAAVGKMADWDEEWLDITKLDLLKEILSPRMQRAKSKGCDALEPDNIDCYDNSDCWSKIPSLTTAAQAKTAQIKFNRWQVEYAHSIGLGIGMKNALALAEDLADIYDFAVNEQCMQYSECDILGETFGALNKAIFHVEYTTASNRCTEAQKYKLSTKYCAGSGNSGVCNSGSSWINCFGSSTLPPTSPSSPSQQPSPTLRPTSRPTLKPTPRPQTQPQVQPTFKPTAKPVALPTPYPTPYPTLLPTWAIVPTTTFPSVSPTPRPTPVPVAPTLSPSLSPTDIGVTGSPTTAPTSFARTMPWGLSWSNLAWGWVNGGSDGIGGYDVVVVDLDEGKDQIRALKERGHIVVCYFSVGTLEPKRPDVQSSLNKWQQASVGPMKGWNEEWLNIDDLDLIKSLQGPRFKRASDLGCDALELDNVDCYDNTRCRNNLPTSTTKAAARATQIKFNRWQIELAHSFGMMVGLKNSLDLVQTMHSEYDFLVVEQCQQYNECAATLPFFQTNKSIFAIEYSFTESRCQDAQAEHLSLKYCTGSEVNGLCTSGDWINCFDLGPPGEDTKQPTFQPTRPRIPLPSFPTTWANLAFGYVDMMRKRIVGNDTISGNQVIAMDLHTPAEMIKEMISKGHTVICVFSAGAVEDFRPDYFEWRSIWDSVALQGANNIHGNTWINIGKLEQVKPLLKHRMEYAKEAGCHGILPTDLNCYEHSNCRSNLGFKMEDLEVNGIPLQIPYNKWIGEYAFELGLAVGLHGSLALVETLEPFFDFSVVESCVRTKTCADLYPFMDHGKPVLNVEYLQTGDDPNSFCSVSVQEGISTKLCRGFPDYHLCGDEEVWTNCFEQIQVTPWPTGSIDIVSTPVPATTGEVTVFWPFVGIGCALFVVGAGSFAFVRRRRNSRLEPVDPNWPSPTSPASGVVAPIGYENEPHPERKASTPPTLLSSAVSYFSFTNSWFNPQPEPDRNDVEGGLGKR